MVLTAASAPILSLPSLSSVHEEQQAPVSKYWQKASELLEGKTLDNGSQTLYYTLSVAGTTNFRKGFFHPADPAMVSQGARCYEVANAAMGAAGIVACGFLVKNGMETHQMLEECETEIEMAKEELTTTNDPAEKYVLETTVAELDQQKVSLTVSLRLICANICNMIVQFALAVISFIGDFLDPKTLLNPNLGGSLSPLGQAILYLGIISSGIGVLLGIYYLYRTISSMCKNREKLEQLQAQKAALEILKNDPENAAFVSIEEQMLTFEEEKLKSEWSHLKASLVSNLFLFLGASLGLVLNCLSGGSFVIISWIVISVMCISGTSSIVHKVYLNRALETKLNQLQDNLTKSLENVDFSTLQPSPVYLATLNPVAKEYLELMRKGAELRLKIYLHRIQQYVPEASLNFSAPILATAAASA